MLVRRHDSGECVTKSVTTGHKTGPACDETGPVFPGSGGRIRTYDLWVMSRHAAVSYRPTHTPTSLVTSPQATPPSQLFRPVSPRDIASWSQIWSHAHQPQDDASDSPAVARGAVGSRPRDGVT